MIYGIDISKHQGTVNWDNLAAQVKAGKIGFVILRAAMVTRPLTRSLSATTGKPRSAAFRWALTGTPIGRRERPAMSARHSWQQ